MDASRFQKRLEDASFLLLDGALATELERQGHDLNHHLWSARVLLDQPDAIFAVHKAYAAAGADILTTATYQATYPGFSKLGLTGSQSAMLLERAVNLALRAAKPDSPAPLIAASLGSYGAFLADGSEYRGDYGIDTGLLKCFHRDRFDTLFHLPVDVLAFETLPCFAEAIAISELLTEEPTAFAWLSFSCRNGRELHDGTAIEECAKLLDGHPQVAAVGVNCVRPEDTRSLLERLRNHTSLPLVAYPNSGETYDLIKKRWEGTSGADQFVEWAGQWAEAGARIIGGCCRTTPGYIRALRKTLTPVPAAG